MSYMKRWIVTYTKHMKQKRKVYQDGFLELGGSGNKIMLYDDSEKLIDSRFLKKDEVIECGGMLTLEGHLVDIGVLEGNHKPLTNLNLNGRNGNLNKRAGTQGQKDANKITLKSGLLQNYSCAAPRKPKVSNKIEFGTSGAPQSHPTATDTTLKGYYLNLFSLLPFVNEHHFNAYVEWNVLYTTQITQKAKKYHDGTLRLALCGSYMKQITLLTEDGAVLSSKFLKSAECVETGNKCELPNYLVEICEARTTQKDDLQKSALEKDAGSSSSSNCKFTIEEKLPTDGPQKDHFEKVDSRCSNIGKFRNSNRLPSNQPLRNACQIISVLKKPLPEENFELRKLPVEQNHPLSTTDVILLDVSSESNMELDMRGMKFLEKSDNEGYDSGSSATQTNTSGSPQVKFKASEEVPTSGITILIDTDFEDKSLSDDVSTCNELTGQLALDALEIRSVMESTDNKYVDQTTSTSRAEVSDATSCSQKIAPDNHQSVYGLSTKLASPSNGLDLADPLSSPLENSSVLCGMSSRGNQSLCESKYENGDQIGPEKNKEEKWESASSLDASASVDVTCGNFEFQPLSNKRPIMDEIPSFDLGF